MSATVTSVVVVTISDVESVTTGEPTQAAAVLAILFPPERVDEEHALSDDATAVTDETPADDTAPVESAEATASTDETETPEAEAVETAAEVETEDADNAPVAEADAAAAVPGVRVASLFVCERGHRTTTLWAKPEVCQARPTRKGPVCGLPLYPINELPEKVQKALNPLKASKKGSKKK